MELNKEIKKIYELSKLIPEENEGIEEDLKRILDYMFKVNELSLDEEESLSSDFLFREDEPVYFDERDLILSASDNREGDFFKVPLAIKEVE